MKTQDVEMAVRPFFKLFQEFSYRTEYSRAYDDFLTISLTQFILPACPIGQEMHKQAIAKYNDKEKKMVGLMFHEMLKTYQHKLSDDTDWYDFFGDMYMELSARSKSKMFGQFFTPDEICNLMTMVTSDGTVTGKTINDPACGSGRLMLSYNAHNRGNYFVAEDIDPMCCKMTVLNFLLHGLEGEVIQHDSLMNPDTYVLRYVVKKFLSFNGVPILQVEVFENGKIPRSFNNQLDEICTPLGIEPSKEQRPIVLQPVQLSFF